MTFKDMSNSDQLIVLQCMRAIAGGNEIEDRQFYTRLGITRNLLKRDISRWPEIDDGIMDSEELLAINNCMNEICNGIRLTPEEWASLFTLPRESVRDVYVRWPKLNGQIGGIR